MICEDQLNSIEGWSVYRGPPDKTILNRQPTSSDLIKQLVFGQDHPGRNASVSLKVAKRRRERRREGMGSKEKKSDDNKTHTIAKAGVGWGANMLPPCKSRPSKLARPFSSPVPSWPGLIPKSVVCIALALCADMNMRRGHLKSYLCQVFASLCWKEAVLAQKRRRGK